MNANRQSGQGEVKKGKLIGGGILQELLKTQPTFGQGNHVIPYQLGIMGGSLNHSSSKKGVLYCE